MTSTRCFIDFAAGDQAAYDEEVKRYKALESWLGSNGAAYGFETGQGPSDLDDVGRETLKDVYEGAEKITLSPSSFAPPRSLVLPRLFLTLSASPGLTKTTGNFLALITDSKGLKSKRAPNPALRYQSSKVHRIEKGFCVQGGDVTRGDGSGGESIYGPTFNDEKEGLKVAHEYGTLAMANSGKNSNSSQFFITLSKDPALLKKLTGKYVAFGIVDFSETSSKSCLERLESLGDGKGGTSIPVWIEKCGL
ncbi:cyclophilin-like protein, partial [Meredithblackwellia eburnea MCA 4105]